MCYTIDSEREHTSRERTTTMKTFVISMRQMKELQQYGWTIGKSFEYYRVGVEDETGKLLVKRYPKRFYNVNLHKYGYCHSMEEALRRGILSNTHKVRLMSSEKGV